MIFAKTKKFQSKIMRQLKFNPVPTVQAVFLLYCQLYSSPWPLEITKGHRLQLPSTSEIYLFLRLSSHFNGSRVGLRGPFMTDKCFFADFFKISRDKRETIFFIFRDFCLFFTAQGSIYIGREIHQNDRLAKLYKNN